MNLADPTRVRVGRSFAGGSILLSLAGAVALTVLGHREILVAGGALNFAALAIGFGVLTWIMIPTQARNAAVWVLAWSAVFAALYVAGLAVAVALTRSSIPGLTYDALRVLSPAQLTRPAAIAIHFRFWAVVPALWLPLTLAPILFPEGHPPTPRWKWVGWWSVVSIGVATVATAIAQNPWSTEPIRSAEDTLEGTIGAVIDGSFALAALSAAVSVASLVVRYRRSTGDTRSQIRWIAWAGALVIFFFFVSPMFEDPGPTSLRGALVGVAIEVVLMGAYGVAILKYRLYDIDVVISKTVTYGVLAAFITGAYSLIVVGVGSLVDRDVEPSLALSIAAVALVAMTFEPLRRRVQHWANVLVFGRRATPYEVLSNATARFTKTSDPDEALVQLTTLIGDGTGASEVVLWLALGDVMQPRSAAPHDLLDRLVPIRVHADALDALPADRVVPVRHHGEVLGALGIRKAKGDAVTESDDKLLNDVAAGAGVLLRNIGLNAELADRADQLRASRRRLVAAHDAERHRLERDLHDGAQQQVVALKVKLGIARTLAEREGAEPVVALVASLADTTQEAVDGMRAVAHGIYPPLLEAEGLEAALGAAKRTIPIPVEIVATGMGRYERPVEESIYFAVLGTITDAVDAGATRAIISLTHVGNAVRFATDVDATPGDLVAVTDRIDAFGGTFTIKDHGEGHVIAGMVPATDHTMEHA